MRIGFDAKRAFMNYTGLGNYSRNIIRSLLLHYPQHEYFLFTPSIEHKDFYNEVKDLPNITIVQPKNRLFSSCWRRYGITPLIKKLNLDVYHGLSNELPANIQASKARKMVTIHDLIPFKEDVFRNVFEDYFYRSKLRSAAQHADLITPISKATSLDIQKMFGTDPQKLRVVEPPILLKPIHQYEDVLANVKIKYKLPEKFLLQVGTVEYRKNIQVIIRALKQLKDPSIHLVIVGRKTRFARSLIDFSINSGLKDQVHFMDPVNDDELACLYLLSKAVVYPSLYEGFGLPIVEAISYGKPVLTTHGSCFEEAGGPGAYYCNTNQVEEVAQTISRMLQGDHAQMLEAGKQYISRFNFKATADTLMVCYKG